MLRHRHVETTIRNAKGSEMYLREAQESVAKKLGFLPKSKNRRTPKGRKTGSKHRVIPSKTPSIRSSAGESVGLRSQRSRVRVAPVAPKRTLEARITAWFQGFLLVCQMIVGTREETSMLLGFQGSGHNIDTTPNPQESNVHGQEAVFPPEIGMRFKRHRGGRNRSRPWRGRLGIAQK